MFCIQIQNSNPYYSLAAEEYFLKQFTEDIFMLWQSTNTVVIGKHQNAMGEINPRFIHEHNIRIARRISGGGTVFHDSGNLNFAYIRNINSPSEINFRQFLEPIIEALGDLGISALSSNRNDLLVDGKKVSGNAQHIFKNRVLHHGTLLINSKLDVLGEAIKVVPGRYHSKAVQSKRSEVTNLLPYLKGIHTPEEFTEFLLEHHFSKPGAVKYEINKTDHDTISKMAEEKFSTWEWNYGYSPRYTFHNTIQLNEKEFIIELQVEKGIISRVSVSGDYFSSKEEETLSTVLKGRKHMINDVEGVLQGILNEVPEELVYSFF